VEDYSFNVQAKYFFMMSKLRDVAVMISNISPFQVSILCALSSDRSGPQLVDCSDLGATALLELHRGPHDK